MTTSNVYNTGIMHWRPGHVGNPACNSRRAIMAMDTADFEGWPRKCRKCEAKLADARRREAAKVLCQPLIEIIGRLEAMRSATDCGA